MNELIEIRVKALEAAIDLCVNNGGKVVDEFVHVDRILCVAEKINQYYIGNVSANFGGIM